MSETLQAGLSLTRKYDIDAARTIAFMGDECRVYSTPALLYDIESRGAQAYLTLAKEMLARRDASAEQDAKPKSTAKKARSS